jgi:phosphatidyl-myo-inositol dimannoside synthase
VRILYISHLHPPKHQPLESIGGMQNVSVQMVRALQKREDVEVDTIILNTSWRFIGIKTFFFLFSLLWRIPSAVKTFKPDVVLFSSMVTAGVLPFLLRKPSVPFVTINHGQDVTLPFSIYQWYLPRVFKQLNGVISVSAATRQASIDRGMNPAIGVALPNGFDADTKKKLPPKDEARQLLEEKFGIDLSEAHLLLTVGRQVKRKGHQWFIEEVIGKIQSNVVYMVIGDGPEHENIIQARENSPMKQKIIITGKQPDSILNAAYAAADLFMMPNIPVEGDMEGFGIVLLEANRAGVPAIASDLEGIKDVIEQGVNGYRVPHGDADAFAGKVDHVIANELDSLSQKAESYVEETFSWKSVVSRYINFLKSV